MEWYSRREVAIALWNRLHDHEVKWLVDDPEIGEFGIRMPEFLVRTMSCNG